MTKTNEKQIFMYYIFLQYIKKLYIDYLNQLLVLANVLLSDYVDLKSVINCKSCNS